MSSLQKCVSITFEIWASNEIIKNRIYDFLDNFLFGVGRYQYLNFGELDISDVEGNRGGTYNMDFGQLLFGGTITCNANYTKYQYKLDDEIVPVIDEILIGG